jgi:hypothetical protein
MDEDEIKLETRLIAVEYLLVQLYCLIYDAAGVSNASMETAHEGTLAGLELQTFQGADPALGDLWAAELRDAVSRLLSDISEKRRAAQK